MLVPFLYHSYLFTFCFEAAIRPLLHVHVHPRDLTLTLNNDTVTARPTLVNLDTWLDLQVELLLDCDIAPLVHLHSTGFTLDLLAAFTAKAQIALVNLHDATAHPFLALDFSGPTAQQTPYGDTCLLSTACIASPFERLQIPTTRNSNNLKPTPPPATI